MRIPFGCMTRSAGVLVAALAVATPALAIDVPSGQPVDLQEVLVEDMGSETWVRFRFVAPDIAREGGSVGFKTATSDMAFLCEGLALKYLAEYALTAQVVVISLADRETEFGTASPDVTQFFESYRVSDNTCIWEGL